MVANCGAASLRSRTVIGINMLTDYALKDDRWQGKIYDPESGNTYQSRMKRNDDGQLEIRGYIGMPMFGRTAVFEPVSLCTADIRAMLSRTDRTDICVAAD